MALWLKDGNMVEIIDNKNMNYMIRTFVSEGMTYLEAVMKYYNEYADEDNLTKFAQSLDSDLIKEIEKESFQEGKLKSVFSESIDNFFTLAQ